jgi:hypothetical protein
MATASQGKPGARCLLLPFLELGTDRPASLCFRCLDLLPSDAHRTNHNDLPPSAVVNTTSEDLIPNEGVQGPDASEMILSTSGGSYLMRGE